MPMQGLEPTPLPLNPAADSALVAMVWGAIIVALLVFPTVLRLWRVFLANLSQRSSKLPGAERTFGERLGQVAALLLYVTMWGILLYCSMFSLRGGDVALNPAPGVAVCAAAALAALLLQVGGYVAVGYAFASWSDTRGWVRALAATQSLLAYALLLPALGALLFPARALWMLALAAALFLLFRIVLWVKCFRIFYNGPFSIFYFFLYLCTLEMVPLLLPVAVAIFAC